MVLNKNYPLVLVFSLFTLLLLVTSIQYSIASIPQSPLQTQCSSFPNVVISGNSNSENNNSNQNNGPGGLKIQVHLSNQNIGNIGPLTIFIITSNGECATANVNQDLAESVGQVNRLTFEFEPGVIDVSENFNACVETSIDFDFVCVVGTNSPTKAPEEVFLDVPIKNENSFVN
jgi:hypothetical protein